MATQLTKKLLTDFCAGTVDRESVKGRAASIKHEIDAKFATAVAIETGGGSKDADEFEEGEEEGAEVDEEVEGLEEEAAETTSGKKRKADEFDEYPWEDNGLEDFSE